MNQIRESTMNMTTRSNLRRSLVCFCLTAGFVALLGGTADAARTQRGGRPNIILILTDDQGYGDTGGNGHPKLKTKTPNFDKLQSEGVSFQDFSVSPTCAPTRCALMTGMHEFKSGVTHTKKPWRYMNLKSATVAQVLKDAGYATGHFGKWHLGLKEGYAPHEKRV